MSDQARGVYQYCDVAYCHDGHDYYDVECPGVAIPAGTWPTQAEYIEFVDKLVAAHRPTCPCAGKAER